MRIYELSLQVVADVCRLAGRVQQHDKDLARQMRRACASVPLNMQEGLYSRGGSRIARFHDSMGSARETMACLHVCIAARYVEKTAVLETLDRIDHVVAGLYRLSYKRTA